MVTSKELYARSKLTDLHTTNYFEYGILKDERVKEGALLSSKFIKEAKMLSLSYCEVPLPEFKIGEWMMLRFYLIECGYDVTHKYNNDNKTTYLVINLSNSTPLIPLRELPNII